MGDNNNLENEINENNEVKEVKGTPFRIKIDMVNTDLFQDVIELIRDCLLDERMPKDVRAEYADKIFWIMDRHKHTK